MKSFVLLASALAVWVSVFAEPVADMAKASRAFLASLDDAQRGKALFAFTDDERQNWHFIPKERKGLTLKEMNSAQKHLVYALLNTGLSQKGFVQATTIMSLEQILQEMEGPNRRFPRDPELYHVSVFGDIREAGTWGWRVEGHHLSVNFTVVNGKLASGTPSFMGTNPAEVRQGSRAGLRVLAEEEDIARELVKSLDAAALKKALFQTTAPDDILTTNSREAVIDRSVGLAVQDMNRVQRRLAERVVQAYLNRTRPELAQAEWEKIRRAGFGKVRFAWAGGLEKNQKHYYRFVGGNFLLEYDNTQNDGNHVHAVWRDFTNDFGRDQLREHYDTDHRAK